MCRALSELTLFSTVLELLRSVQRAAALDVVLGWGETRSWVIQMNAHQQPEPFEIADAKLIRVWHWPQVLACFGGAAGLYAAIAGLLAAFAAQGAQVALSVMAFYGCLAVATVLSIVKTRAKPANAVKTESVVRASPQGLWVDGKLVAKRIDLKTGLVLPSNEGAVVRLRPTGSSRGEIDLVVKSMDKGQALLKALELDGGHAIAYSRARGPFANVAVAFYLLLSVGVGALAHVLKTAEFANSGRIAMLAILVLLLASLVLAAIPSRITVGTDGILLEWLGLWKRYIPMRDIAKVEVDPKRWGVVNLTLTSGKVESISQGRRPIGRLAMPETTALRNQIEQAVAASRSSEHVAEASQVLLRAKQGDDHGAWVGELRKLLDREAGFRDQVLAPDRLWSVVEDAAAQAQARAAAAVALSPLLDQEGKERLRIASNAIAEPKLRVALEAAEGDSEERMAEALAELEAASDGDQVRAG